MVRGTPFYGYHPNELLFIKVSMFDPNLIKKTASLLQSGTILNRHFQPYESHIPFLLQFFADYNLAGMGLLHLIHLTFRPSLPKDGPPDELRTPDATEGGSNRVWRHDDTDYSLVSGFSQLSQSTKQHRRQQQPTLQG